MAHNSTSTDIRIGLETTRGTSASSGYWIPKSSLDFYDQVEYIKQEAPFGVNHEFQDADLAKKMGSGNIEFPVFSDSIGVILAAVFGATPTTSDVTTNESYSHVFSVAQNATHQTVTITKKDPVEELEFVYSMIDSFELSYSLGEYLSASVGFESKSGETASETVSYTNLPKFRPQDTKIYIADTVSGLDSGTEVKVESFTLSISKNTEEYMAHGSLEREDIFNNRFSYSGSMELLWDSTTFKDLFKGGSKKALRIESINTNETIGASSDNPSLTFDIAPAIVEELAPQEDNSSVVRQSVGFTGIYDVENDQSIEATLINGVATY